MPVFRCAFAALAYGANPKAVPDAGACRLLPARSTAVAERSHWWRLTCPGGRRRRRPSRRRRCTATGCRSTPAQQQQQMRHHQSPIRHSKEGRCMAQRDRRLWSTVRHVRARAYRERGRRPVCELQAHRRTGYLWRMNQAPCCQGENDHMSGRACSGCRRPCANGFRQDGWSRAGVAAHTVCTEGEQRVDWSGTHLQGGEDAAEHEVVQLARQALLLAAGSKAQSAAPFAPRRHWTAEHCKLIRQHVQMRIPSSPCPAVPETAVMAQEGERCRHGQCALQALAEPSAIQPVPTQARHRGRALHLRLSLSFFMTSFCLAACLERWNMEGSQLLARSTLMLGALPPRSCGSCAQPTQKGGVSKSRSSPASNQGRRLSHATSLLRQPRSFKINFGDCSNQSPWA